MSADIIYLADRRPDAAPKQPPAPPPAGSRSPTFKWHSLRPDIPSFVSPTSDIPPFVTTGDDCSSWTGAEFEPPSKEAVEVALFRRLSAALDLFLAHNGQTITEEALKSLIASRNLQV